MQPSKKFWEPGPQYYTYSLLSQVSSHDNTELFWNMTICFIVSFFSYKAAIINYTEVLTRKVNLRFQIHEWREWKNDNLYFLGTKWTSIEDLWCNYCYVFHYRQGIFSCGQRTFRRFSKFRWYYLSSFIDG